MSTRRDERAGRLTRGARVLLATEGCRGPCARVALTLLPSRHVIGHIRTVAHEWRPVALAILALAASLAFGSVLLPPDDNSTTRAEHDVER